MTMREAVAKLSPEDRERYDFDIIAYGNAMLREHEDGSVTYVPMKDWPAHLQKSPTKT